MKSGCSPAAIAAISILALPTSPMAQTTTSSPEEVEKTYVQIEDETMLVGPFNIRVAELDEFEVFDASGKKVGEIEEVLADSSGAPVAVVIAREGQSAYEGDRIVVSLDRLELIGANLQIDMTRQELEASPKWDD